MYCKNSACSEESLQQTTGKKNVLISYSFCYCEWQLTAKMSMSKVGKPLQIPLGKKVIQNTVCNAYLILGTVQRDIVV